MGYGCNEMGGLLLRRRTGLSEAEGLLLEVHLESCETCVRDRALLDAMDELTTDLELGERRREWAVRIALR